VLTLRDAYIIQREREKARERESEKKSAPLCGLCVCSSSLLCSRLWTPVGYFTHAITPLYAPSVSPQLFALLCSHSATPTTHARTHARTRTYTHTHTHIHTQGKGSIFTTDIALAVLMSAPRSVASWDILSQRAGGCLYLDVREGSSVFDNHVNETAQA
jgi:hypothetical protein